MNALIFHLCVPFLTRVDMSIACLFYYFFLFFLSSFRFIRIVVRIKKKKSTDI